MSHMYAIARQLQAPGVETVATFNPARLTKTVRNMTRKSIASGYHIGGWSSKTKAVRKLVLELAGERPVFYISQHADYMNLCSPRKLTEDTIQELIGLAEADAAMQKMAYADYAEGTYRPSRQQLYDTVDERLRAIKDSFQRIKHVPSQFIIVRNPKIRQQIANTFLKDRTNGEAEIAERIASMLDEDKSWNIPLNHKF